MIVVHGASLIGKENLSLLKCLAMDRSSTGLRIPVSQGPWELYLLPLLLFW